MAKKKKSPEFMQAAYKLQKLVGVAVLPAEEAVRAFARVHAKLEGEAGPIEAGIRETLGIKIEGLQEAIRELREEVAGISTAFAHEKANAAAYYAQAEKAAARFKKNVLLHEIITFEEILTHSVPRIEATPAAACLRETYSELETILRKNGIEAIRPEPHTAWNAREHEVLIAEEAEGYAKGEIIKCVGTGFRAGGEVLVRANVIAAK